MSQKARDILNSNMALKEGLITVMNDYAKLAFEAGREQRTVRTQGNWNPNDFSDYEEHKVNQFETFEDYLKTI